MEPEKRGRRTRRSCLQAIAKAETVRGNAARLGRSAHAVPRQDTGTGRAGGAAALILAGRVSLSLGRARNESQGGIAARQEQRGYRPSGSPGLSERLPVAPWGGPPSGPDVPLVPRALDRVRQPSRQPSLGPPQQHTSVGDGWRR